MGAGRICGQLAENGSRGSDAAGYADCERLPPVCQRLVRWVRRTAADAVLSVPAPRGDGSPAAVAELRSVRRQKQCRSVPCPGNLCGPRRRDRFLPCVGAGRPESTPGILRTPQRRAAACEGLSYRELYHNGDLHRVLTLASDWAGPAAAQNGPANGIGHGQKFPRLEDAQSRDRSAQRDRQPPYLGRSIAGASFRRRHRFKLDTAQCR